MQDDLPPDPHTDHRTMSLLRTTFARQTSHSALLFFAGPSSPTLASALQGRRPPPPLSSSAGQQTISPRRCSPLLSNLHLQRRPFSTKSAGEKTLPETVGEGAFERLTWEGYLAKRKCVVPPACPRDRPEHTSS